jgi:hypothetical protein
MGNLFGAVLKYYSIKFKSRVRKLKDDITKGSQFTMDHKKQHILYFTKVENVNKVVDKCEFVAGIIRHSKIILKSRKNF